MQAENIKDYELIRTEMSSLKSCITNYMGFVIGGSGIALYELISKSGFVSNTVSNQSIDYGTIALTSLALSLLISLILVILFYKFNSHNRYAGYCKLITHEKFDIELGGDVIAWELCLEHFRQFDLGDKNLIELVNVMDDKNPLKEILGDKLLLIERGKWPNNLIKKFKWIEDLLPGLRFINSIIKLFAGFLILLSASIGVSRANSWRFPPFVTSIFFVICLGFTSIGLYSYDNLTPNPDNEMFFIIVLIIGLFQLTLWMGFFIRLYSLMYGRTTIDSFYWRFIPIRFYFLKELGITPDYMDTELIP